MKDRIIIPNTDLMPISPIGLGTVNAGLDWDGAEADRLLETYVELGGNLVDSARIYSDWVKPEIARSERVIGDWIARRGHRDDVILISKGGHPPLEDLHHSRMKKEDMEYDLNATLKNMRLDYLDLYFYHRDDLSQPVSDLIDVMEEFVKQGKIRYYGCSNWTAARMAEADAYAKSKGYRGFTANQMMFNIASKYMKPFDDDTMVPMDDAMMEYHRNNPENLAMPYFGVCSGFFHIIAAKGLDAVKNSPYYTPENLKIVDRVNELCKKYGCSISQVLLGFFHNQDFQAVPLAGAENVAQLTESMKTMEFDFKKEDYQF